MSETARMWVEIVFNISYLGVIWGLVAAFWVRRGGLTPDLRRQSDLAMYAFALLALGDTGHVGFRVWAYALGGLEASLPVFGGSLSLVGVGALATAVTVTFFYMLMLELWRVHFNRTYGAFEYLLLSAGIVRLILMVAPLNHWEAVVPPQPWGAIRNLPLIIQGLGLAYLTLREARRANDRPFWWIGVSILVSYACYLPVVLFVQWAPMLGMLMIPKTLAYVAIGWIAYAYLHPRRQRRLGLKPSAGPAQTR